MDLTLSSFSYTLLRLLSNSESDLALSFPRLLPTNKTTQSNVPLTALSLASKSCILTVVSPIFLTRLCRLGKEVITLSRLSRERGNWLRGTLTRRVVWPRNCKTLKMFYTWAQMSEDLSQVFVLASALMPSIDGV